MFVLYCVGAVLAGIAAIEAIIAFLTDGRASAACGILLDCVSVFRSWSLGENANQRFSWPSSRLELPVDVLQHS